MTLARDSGAGQRRVCIAGVSGRMGRMLLEAVQASADLRLGGAIDVAGSAGIGQDPGAALGRPAGVVTTANIEQGLADAEVLIDFTRPEGTLAHLAACRERGMPAVVGTTGFSAAQRAELAAHAQHIAIVFAPNMSVGVSVMLGLVERAAAALGAGYDIEVVEAHHRHKIDAPSGTALALGEAAAAGRGLDLSTHAVYGRHGNTGERPTDAIGFATVRGGDIVGRHTVMFAGTGERLEITHESGSRANYAEGSLRAARFLLGRAPGLYDMGDVLGR